jgi:superfamily I DNA/RNA helicase
VNRSQLHERVWSKAIHTLAKEFDLSDTGLKKVCVRNGIPVPERGYWAKVAAGHTVERAELSGNPHEEIPPFGNQRSVSAEENLFNLQRRLGGRVSYKVLDAHVETTSGHVSISAMHLAKGLEFRAVVVMACDDEVIPLQERIETVGDESDLQEVYDTERHLLYVACTRARDHLLVTSVEPASEFLDDLRGG